jgi:predicted Ser/Thr protein kinase
MTSSLPPRIGRYEVVDRLGSGGMGVVYLATDPLLRRTVALKVLPGDNEDLRERFAREARSAASLRHNNIVTIYDVGEDNGQPFMAMEFLDGESMAEMIRRRAPMPLTRRLRLIIELCAGLGYAHRNGIIHRDIKPANLMITTEEGLKILDFGLARLVEEPTLAGLTRAGTLLGTPNYLSPEQIAGKSADQGSDIFAVGLVLYELLSYRKAFPGESPQVVLLDIVEKEPTPIRQFIPDLDEQLERVVARALEKDRDRRYPELRVLADDLEEIRMRTAGTAEDSTWSRKHRRDGGGTAWTHDVPTSDGSHQRLDAIASKRAAQITQHLAAAADRLASGDVDAALEHCEHALMLDPEDERALGTLRRAHRAKEDAQVHGWIETAKGQLQRGAVTEAEALIEQSLRVRANHPEALSLQKYLREQRQERERQAERQRAAEAAMERAARHLERGALEAVIRSASEALAHSPDHAEARELRARAVTMVEERERQARHDEAAHEIVAKARELASHEDLDAALTLLRTFPTPHPMVTGLIAELDARITARDDRENSTADEPPAPPIADAEPAERAALEPANAEVTPIPRPAASEPARTHEPLPAAAHLRSGQDDGVALEALWTRRNRYLIVVVATGLVAVGFAAWLALSSRSGGSPPPASGAQADTPADSTTQPVAQRRADRLLATANERLAAQDPEGATAAIQEVERLLPLAGRAEATTKQIDGIRAAARQLELQRDDVRRALDQAAAISSDNDAIARLQREIAKYPGNVALTNAVGERTKARDTKIADLVRFAQRAPDAQAVTLLAQAMDLDKGRLDVRRELDRRRASLLAAGKAPGTRETIEKDVRETLFAYQSAYASRSVDAFLKVAPFRTRAQIESEFRRFRSIQLNIEGIDISLDERGTRAVVKCIITSVSVPADPNNSRPVSEKRAWEFQLAKAGSVWQITSASAR